MPGPLMTTRRVIYVATHNKHKLAEIKAMLQGQLCDVRDLSQLPNPIAWEEIGNTFEDNAKIKAIAVNQETTDCILADDSGLCVEALGGAPGVHSHRYAGPEGDDAANRKKLLAALSGAANRQAHFVCCLVYVNEEGIMQSFEGRLDGTIALKERGQGGFGYDPIFIPAGHERTLAEFSAAEKNEISHRRRALEAWRQALADQARV